MATMPSGEEVIREDGERIYVSVRLRPSSAREILRNDVSDWECINDQTIVYKNVSLSTSERSMYPSAYSFDRVFKGACSTREVYELGAKDVAISPVKGINSSVFAYGQTSSGKTYTMTGITEYAIADIYDHIKKHSGRKFLLKFSAMEIYNESVRDLLSLDSTPLRLLDDPERGTVVEKLTEEILTDWNHVIQLLSVCETQRQIGETSLNETSSRSHQIIRLTIESSSCDISAKDNASTLTASVNFVDLAGSERASQSLSAGTRLKEGCHINRSLLTLGTVVRKLSKNRNGHIPYRDSKLTRILQASLGGNARTAIICTMSPARSHVEQSRNTLLFASCAKEVTTNAQVNVVLSDKALVKHLQRELQRLQGELRTSNYTPSNYSETLREKDLQIEELERTIKELTLQRDIAQSQVKGLLKMHEDNAGSMAVAQTGLGQYPQLRMRTSLASSVPKLEMTIFPEHDFLVEDTRTYSDRHSRSSSDDHFAEIPLFDIKVAQGSASPRILTRSPNFSESHSSHDWEGIEKQINGTSDDLYKEVRCIEVEESTRKETMSFLPQKETGFSSVKPTINADGRNSGFPSPSLAEDKYFISTPLKRKNEMKGYSRFEPMISRNGQELPPASSKESGESKELDSIHFLDMSSLENLSVTRALYKDSSGSRGLKLTRSQSCRESFTGDSSSPWYERLEDSENTPSFFSKRVFKGFERKISPLNFGSIAKHLATEDSPLSPGNPLVIEIDTPDVNLLTGDKVSRNAEDMMVKKILRDDEHEITNNMAKEIQRKASASLNKSVKNVGLDPMEDELAELSSWPAEFKRIQMEIFELWEACNISLVHRSYFFILFQGDPSDAMYLEVELRRLKFLSNKFSRGEKTIVNGKGLTLESSAKALRQERRMLSKQMAKKLSEHDRESLFLKWGIGLYTKLRRLQLASCVWTSAVDVNHIADSAFLVVKLVGSVEPGQTPKEMFGLDFTPRCSARSFSFRRDLLYSIL